MTKLKIEYWWVFFSCENYGNFLIYMFLPGIHSCQSLPPDSQSPCQNRLPFSLLRHSVNWKQEANTFFYSYKSSRYYCYTFPPHTNFSHFLLSASYIFEKCFQFFLFLIVMLNWIHSKKQYNSQYNVVFIVKSNLIQLKLKFFWMDHS